MSSFNESYAAYYDLLYKDKDYTGEAEFVRSVLLKHSPDACALIELGCGTGRHARELARTGYRVLGIDLSAQMVARANQEKAGLVGSLQERLLFVQGDASQFRTEEKFDAAISLFHVVNYHLSNASLHGYFETVARALRPGGVFLFDFWYGPAVLSDRPVVRIANFETSGIRLTRLAEPSLEVNRNQVSVKYTMIARKGSGQQLDEFSEQHTVRYLFMPEIEQFASTAGLSILETGQWLSSQPLSDKTWYGYCVLRHDS